MPQISFLSLLSPSTPTEVTGLSGQETSDFAQFFSQQMGFNQSTSEDGADEATPFSPLQQAAKSGQAEGEFLPFTSLLAEGENADLLANPDALLNFAVINKDEVSAEQMLSTLPTPLSDEQVSELASLGFVFAAPLDETESRDNELAELVTEPLLDSESESESTLESSELSPLFTESTDETGIDPVTTQVEVKSLQADEPVEDVAQTSVTALTPLAFEKVGKQEQKDQPASSKVTLAITLPSDSDGVEQDTPSAFQITLAFPPEDNVEKTAIQIPLLTRGKADRNDHAIATNSQPANLIKTVSTETLQLESDSEFLIRPSSLDGEAAEGDVMDELSPGKTENSSDKNKATREGQVLERMVARAAAEADPDSLELESNLNQIRSQTQRQSMEQQKAIEIPIRQQVQHSEWGRAVSERIMMMASRHIQVAQIRLDPPELGLMEVKVTVQNEQTQVHIVTSHAQVREALEAAIPRLRTMLEEQGMQLLNADISERQEQQAQGEQQDGSQKQGNGSDSGDWSEEAEMSADQLMARSLVDHYV